MPKAPVWSDAADPKPSPPAEWQAGTVLNQIALYHHTRAAYTAAEPLSQSSRNIWEKVLGPEHPDVAIRLGHFSDTGSL